MKKYISTLCVLIALISVLSACNKKTAEAEVTRYEIDLTLDMENMTVTASQEVIYTNNTDTTLNEIVFHIYANAFSKNSPIPVAERHYDNAYYNGESYGSISIKHLEVEGKTCNYTEDNQLLRVPTLDLIIGESVTISMTYEIIIPCVKHRFGYNDKSINLGNFYPQVAVYESGSFRDDPYYGIGDPFYSEIAYYNVKVNAPSDYSVAGTGEAVHSTSNIKTKNIEYVAENVRDFALILSDEYEFISANCGSVAINYYYYNDENAEDTLSVACQAIELFSELIGAYPYQTFNVAQAGFIYGGMEYPQLVFISDELSVDNIGRVLVHEIAHQWWYGIVGSDSINEAWVDEGLAEFMTLTFYDKIGDAETKDKLVDEAFNRYTAFQGVTYRLPEGITGEMQMSLSEYASEEHYITMVYVKGLLMYNTLYEIMGEDIYKALRIYYEKCKYTNASAEILIACFEKANNMKVEKIFDAWINGYVVMVR